ncbi:hypothetical protein PVK06_021696 [Gossypium arboreum]|uniref:Uncharacterized protein n=1 Tax=Gossypium arboreum TaxID=29729 RepID=A0ABR0PR93_GOSAR|nr:hypothetical protein PVK06_021696 [Gossypium arboreum]
MDHLTWHSSYDGERTATQQRGDSMAMQQMHEAKAMEKMGCDERCEGDGGDGLRCTGRRRWRRWVVMHREIWGKTCRFGEFGDF